MMYNILQPLRMSCCSTFSFPDPWHTNINIVHLACGSTLAQNYWVFSSHSNHHNFLKLEPLTNALPLLISHFLTSHTHHSLWIMIFVSSPTYHLQLFFAIDNSIFNNMVLYRLNYSFVHNKNHYIYARSICHTTASRFHFHDNQHIKLPLPSILYFMAHGYYYNLPLIYTHIHRYSFALFHCLFHNSAHTITNLSLPT